MKKQTTIILACVILALTLLCGCSNGNYPVKIGDTIIKEQPKSIVCLTAAAEDTASLFMEGETKITGVCDTSAADKKIARVGDFSNPDVEKIASLNCDLLLTTTALSDEVFQKLKLVGINVATVEAPVKFDGLKEYYTKAAKIFVGNKNYKDKVNDAMSLLNCNTESDKTALVFLTPSTAVTPDTVVSRLLECAGYKNALQKGENYSMAQEDVLSVQPDVIICDTGTMEAIKANYPSFAAVQNGNVYEVDLSVCLIPGKNLSTGISAIKNAVTD